MADRIKGITIELNGDTTKLSDSLKDVNKAIKDTSAQLKDVEKLLKIDPGNMELLAQKQELLGRQTENTKKKSEELKKALQEMKAAGVDELSDDYMKVQRELTECEQEQKKLTEEAKKTDEQIVKCGNSAGKLGSKLKSAGDKMKNVSKAAAGIVTGLVGSAIKSGQMADEWNTISKQTGLSTETIQKMQYAADLMDVDFETIESSMRKMKKQMESGEDKFKAIGVSTKDINGNLRDSETVFYDTIRALGRIENETERDVIAMDIFGKSADDLAGILDDGGEAMRQLGDEAVKNGSIISQDQIDKANEFNDSLDRMKATVGNDLLQAGMQLAEALTPLIQELVPVITEITTKVSNLSPETMKLILVIGGVLAALAPVLKILGTIITYVPILVNGIGAVVAAIGAPLLIAIAAVGAALYVWVTKWEEIKAGFQAFAEIFQNTIEQIKAKINTFVNNFNTKMEQIKQTAEFVWNAIKAIFNRELPKPKIKLPHIKITGSWSMNPPSAPKFGIDWYRKAYDDAYLLNSPTIFGMSGNTLLGGGEGNGSEAVVGTDKLMSMISDVVGSQNITVVLEGDAGKVFQLVRTENTRFMKSNGYSPLMG